MREKTSRGIRTTIIVFIVLLFVVGVIAAWRYFGNTPDDSDTTNTTDTSTVQTDETADTNNTDEN
ncbi:hypothetical protein GW746_01915, partial [Candidatus Saccharibacteria bacterium]|nr:hypothetical protein [Candidatus Saccharibacteria bacterium]